MRISSELETYLDTFRCLRLTEIDNCSDVIESFTNKRGGSILSRFKQKGLQEDSEGDIAYYVVLTEDNVPCLFFSLQCGALYDVPFDDKSHKKKIALFGENTSWSEDPKKQIWFTSLKQRIVYFVEDLKREGGRSINRVNQLFSSIEIVHLCVNEEIKETLDSIFYPHKTGEVLFWRFIVPKLLEIKNIVGCCYTHLFAADPSPDGSLINHYREFLKFERNDKLGTSKPFYDFSCAFMSQRIAVLKQEMEAFFNNFSIDEDTPII